MQSRKFSIVFENKTLGGDEDDDVWEGESDDSLLNSRTQLQQ